MYLARYLLGGALALAVVLSGSLAYAQERPQGFKNGYELVSPIHTHDGVHHAALEANPERNANYHERTGIQGRVVARNAHTAKAGGCALREVQPFSALSIRSHSTS